MKKAMGKNKKKQTLRQLLVPDVDVAELEDTLGLKLEQVSLWALDEQTQNEVEGLMRWLDMQTQIMIARYRLAAVARLYDLVNTAKNEETARRACLDLLKTNLLGQRDETVTSLRVSRETRWTQAVELNPDHYTLNILEKVGREMEAQRE